MYQWISEEPFPRFAKIRLPSSSTKEVELNLRCCMQRTWRRSFKRPPRWLTKFTSPYDILRLTRPTTITKTAAMEEDRIATNLGPETNGDVQSEVVVPTKQPRRRFVGRRAADQAAAQSNGANGSIEDSGAIQGVNSPNPCVLS